MDHDKTGCQAAPEGPILCVNNCGFFGSAATMNMCSKCHKDITMKQEQAKLAASSIGNFVNGSPSSSSGTRNVNANAGVVAVLVGLQTGPMEPKPILSAPMAVSGLEGEPKSGPKRCFSCNKRVGLTGFSCRCGSLFCGQHRYSDKHECPYDYRTEGRDAIAKANPVVKAEKLDKI